MDLTCSVRTDAGASTASRVSGVKTWLVPDVALLFSLLTLAYCLLIFDGTRQLFRDSDAGWHIRTGEAILGGSGLPRADTYSFSRAGQPWFAWEWGADLLMGAAHLAGGSAYVAGLYAFAIAACTYLWFRLHWAAGGNFLVACLLAIPMLTTTMLHWHARPHVFGWLLVLGAVLYAERTERSYIAVAAGSAVWANLHASFFLGGVIALTYAVSHAVRPMLWEGLDSRKEREQARWFAGAGAVSLAATLLNPYGWRLHEHVLRYLSNGELLDRVGEFQSFNFHVDGAWQIVLTMGVAGLGAVLALQQRSLARCVLSVVLLSGALRSARMLPLVALVALPFANGGLSYALRNASGLRPFIRSRLDRFIRYCGNLRSHDRSLGGVATAPAAAALTIAVLSLPAVAARAGFPRETFPVDAAEAVSRLPERTRLLAPDLYGGYLIYRFHGERKVWFDGRSDFYGAAFMKEYLSLIELRPEWEKQVEHLRFTHALLPNRYSLVPALEGRGWKKVYSDRVATLLEAPAGDKR